MKLSTFWIKNTPKVIHFKLSVKPIRVELNVHVVRAATLRLLPSHSSLVFLLPTCGLACIWWKARRHCHHFTYSTCMKGPREKVSSRGSQLPSAARSVTRGQWVELMEQRDREWGHCSSVGLGSVGCLSTILTSVTVLKAHMATEKSQTALTHNKGEETTDYMQGDCSNHISN